MSRLEVANECGRIGKTRRLGKKVSHLNFGVLARLDTTVQLDDIVVVNQRGAVGLLALNRANHGWGIQRPAPEFARWLEVQPPTRAGNGSLAPKVIQELPNESRISCHITQQSFALALMQTRHDGPIQFGTCINGPVGA